MSLPSHRELEIKEANVHFFHLTGAHKGGRGQICDNNSFAQPGEYMVESGAGVPP